MGLGEGNIGIDLSLEGLRNEETYLFSKLVALDLVVCVLNEAGNLLIDAEGRGLNLLVGLGLHEIGEISLDVVEANTVSDSEDPVGKAGDLAGTGLELLDLDGVLAGDDLIRHLNGEVVNVLNHLLSLRADFGEIASQKAAKGSVTAIDNLIDECVGLINLEIAGGFGRGDVVLGSHGIAAEELPRLVVGLCSDGICIGICHIDLTLAHVLVDGVKGREGDYLSSEGNG